MYGAQSVLATMFVAEASVVPVNDITNMVIIIHVAALCRPDANTGIQANPSISCAAIRPTPVHCTTGETVVLGDVTCSHKATAAKT